MREFFGFGGYERTPEGFLSWQHLVFASVFLIAMIAVSIIIGLRFRNKDEKAKNKVLVWTAILIVASEVFHITICCIRENSFTPILHNLPLFLCSIQFITIPLAAFAKGRIKEAALDFVFVFGILSAVMGVFGAGQNFNAYPVISFDNVISAITHTISGFASLYIVISNMTSMKSKNIWITYMILISVCVLAYIADILIPELRYEKREIAKVVILNTKNVILRIINISLGGTNFTLLEPKDVLTEAVKMQAPKIILVHNHPSGDATPSKSDYNVTDRVFEAAELMGIELLDHIVIGDGTYQSILRQKNAFRKDVKTRC